MMTAYLYGNIKYKAFVLEYIGLVCDHHPITFEFVTITTLSPSLPSYIFMQYYKIHLCSSFQLNSKNLFIITCLLFIAIFRANRPARSSWLKIELHVKMC